MKNRRTKGIYIALVICMVTLVLAGCNLKIGYVSKSSTKKMSASFFFLTDTKEKSIKLKSGDLITFDYELKEKKGTLTATFEDSSGDVIYTFEPNTEGKKEINIDYDDTYKLIITANKARGSYIFEW